LPRGMQGGTRKGWRIPPSKKKGKKGNSSDEMKPNSDLISPWGKKGQFHLARSNERKGSDKVRGGTGSTVLGEQRETEKPQRDGERERYSLESRVGGQGKTRRCGGREQQTTS